jgi:Acyl-CoA oxidase
MQGELPPGTASVLLQLAQMFGVNVIDKQLGDFLEDGYMSGVLLLSKVSTFTRGCSAR